jgi:hypothetical protein
LARHLDESQYQTLSDAGRGGNEPRLAILITQGAENQAASGNLQVKFAI